MQLLTQETLSKVRRGSQRATVNMLKYGSFNFTEFAIERITDGETYNAIILFCEHEGRLYVTHSTKGIPAKPRMKRQTGRPHYYFNNMALRNWIANKFNYSGHVKFNVLPDKIVLPGSLEVWFELSKAGNE